MIRILIADDHPVVRAGVRALLAGEPDFDVVGEAASAAEAAQLALEPPDGVPIDVVLMDLQFGAGGSGADATRTIRASVTAPAVLVLTNYDTDGDILGAIEAGASGYLLKDSPPDELIAAIRAAAAGESALAPAIAGRLLARVRSPQQRLSSREIEVLRFVAEGAANSDIAARLHISEATVKSHLAHVYGKLDVSSRTAAVAAARELGMLR